MYRGRNTDAPCRRTLGRGASLALPRRMRPLLLSLVFLVGCYGPMGPHEGTLDPIGAAAQALVNFADAQDVPPVHVPTNGCLPIDYYVGGATFLIRTTPDGCEWIAYSETGRELARGMVPVAGS